MKLHEAIKLVLTENKRPMTAGEIADEVNSRNLYKRADGSPVPTSQIHARIRRYPVLFKKTINEAIELSSGESDDDKTSTIKIHPSSSALSFKTNKDVKQSKNLNILTLENFRTYKEKVSIDLAPLTILTGKNNAGKSTIFKALLLLTDYLNSNNHFILEFDGANAHKHKIDCIDNALSWNSDKQYFMFEYDKDGYTFRFVFGKENNHGILTYFNVLHNDTGKNLSLKKTSKTVYEVEFDNDFVENNLSGNNQKIQREIESLSRQIMNYNDILSKLNKEVEELEKYEKGSLFHMQSLSQKNTYDKKLRQVIRRKNELIKELNKVAIKNDFRIKSELDLSKTDELYDSKLTTVLRKNISHYYMTDDFKKKYGNQDNIRAGFQLMHFFDRLNSSMLVDMTHLGPNRTHQARLYINRNRDNEINEIMNFYAHHEPKSGSKIDLFLKEWMRKFDIGESIKVKDFQATASYIMITDEGKEQNLTDKGFGAGQVLTLLMKIANEVQKSKMLKRGLMVYRKSEPTIIIEEPETNLHPEFQSKLAEMFYEAYEQFNVRFILETHSEYLIRKTQTIIKNIGNQDVFKVYYIDKSKGLYEMKYRSDGKFINEFGSGFFDESTNLSLELF